MTLWGKTGSRPGYTDGVFATVDLQRIIAYGFTPTSRQPDTSAFVLASANYSLGDNLTLVAGAQVPIGRRGSEFGGLRLSPADPRTLGPPTRLYVQLRRYF